MAKEEYIREALYIRKIEETLLSLFSMGKTNGTMHACIGQEFSAIAFVSPLCLNDYVISNHRCHGHYLAYTKDYIGLLAELMGKRIGPCAGIGGSQHLHKGNFYSNGVQGGMIPIAAGFALANKLGKSDSIVVAFMGDGTLGEGVVYETMNIIAKWQLPLLLVCENNCYAQSTKLDENLSGSILKRAESFGISSYHSNIWDLETLFTTAKESIDYVRNNIKPAFHLMDLYRLCPHSKGDDYRDKDEVQKYSMIDPINVFMKNHPLEYKSYQEEIDNKVKDFLEDLNQIGEININEYITIDSFIDNEYSWGNLPVIKKKQSEQIYNIFVQEMAQNEKILFMGEDISYPYGGAFKIAKDLSIRYPTRVLSTPISEAAITGIANGLALAGYRPVVEIMFGDFITLCIDQILNHAAKFHDMYYKRANCPIVVRTPMGGGRGYGPTHSQTLDKLLLTIDSIKVIALNKYVDPAIVYKTIFDKETDPVVVIENKIDYSKNIGGERIDQFKYEVAIINEYPVVRIRPVISQPTVTIVTYGGAAGAVHDCMQSLFFRYDIKAEVIILSKLKPLDYSEIIRSINCTKHLYIVEEGSMSHGIGSEIIASVSEKITGDIVVRRIAAQSHLIPANKSIEANILINVDKIINTIKSSYKWINK